MTVRLVTNGDVVGIVLRVTGALLVSVSAYPDVRHDPRPRHAVPMTTEVVRELLLLEPGTPMFSLRHRTDWRDPGRHGARARSLVALRS